MRLLNHAAEFKPEWQHSGGKSFISFRLFVEADPSASMSSRSHLKQLFWYSVVIVSIIKCNFLERTGQLEQPNVVKVSKEVRSGVKLISKRDIQRAPILSANPIKPSAAQPFYPQQMRKQTNYNERLSPWNPPNSQEPANALAPVSQEEARVLESYMKNRLGDTGQPLNLASINDRRPQQERLANPFRDSKTSLVEQNYGDRVPLSYHQQSDSISSRRDDSFVKKGRVDDVILFNSNNPLKSHPVSPVKQIFSHKQLLADKWAQNCLTRSAPIASSCEDTLIKRLSQDATEGRTVIDVGRRVCCALFWHKDCINRVVVENCPDSSPAAADFLLGSRKLDLTLSCQRFNRDGCNGSQSRYSFCMLSIIIFSVAQTFLYRLLRFDYID